MKVNIEDPSLRFRSQQFFLSKIFKKYPPFGAKIWSDICPRTLSVPRRKLRATRNRLMFKDKYPNIFSAQMEALVFIMLQIFFATRAVLKIGGYSRISPSFSWGIFGHVRCLGQSCASEKI